jgi:hypothetical protein
MIDGKTTLDEVAIYLGIPTEALIEIFVDELEKLNESE